MLSPIDLETWRVIAEVSGVNSTSRVIELASGKGAFARYLAKNFRCRVDGIDRDADFVLYSNGKAAEEGLQGLVNFRNDEVNQLKVELHTYDLGVCLGRMIFQVAARVAPAAKDISLWEVESKELQKLADGYTSKDKATKNRVLEILGIKSEYANNR